LLEEIPCLSQSGNAVDSAAQGLSSLLTHCSETDLMAPRLQRQIDSTRQTQMAMMLESCCDIDKRLYKQARQV
jgi:hypothetical protein